MPIKPDVFDPVRIRVGTPLFLAISIYIQLTQETLPPLGNWGRGEG